MEFLSDSDKAKSLLRSGRGISKAFEEAGFTDRAAEVEVSGLTVLEAETGSFGVRESPEDFGTGIFKLIRGMMVREGPADGGSP